MRGERCGFSLQDVEDEGARHGCCQTLCEVHVDEEIGPRPVVAEVDASAPLVEPVGA